MDGKRPGAQHRLHRRAAHIAAQGARVILSRLQVGGRLGRNLFEQLPAQLPRERLGPRLCAAGAQPLVDDRLIKPHVPRRKASGRAHASSQPRLIFGHLLRLLRAVALGGKRLVQVLIRILTRAAAVEHSIGGARRQLPSLCARCSRLNGRAASAQHLRHARPLRHLGRAHAGDDARQVRRHQARHQRRIGAIRLCRRNALVNERILIRQRNLRLGPAQLSLHHRALGIAKIIGQLLKPARHAAAGRHQAGHSPRNICAALQQLQPSIQQCLAPGALHARRLGLNAQKPQQIHTAAWQPGLLQALRIGQCRLRRCRHTASHLRCMAAWQAWHADKTSATSPRCACAAPKRAAPAHPPSEAAPPQDSARRPHRGCIHHAAALPEDWYAHPACAGSA